MQPDNESALSRAIGEDFRHLVCKTKAVLEIAYFMQYTRFSIGSNAKSTVLPAKYAISITAKE